MDDHGLYLRVRPPKATEKKVFRPRPLPELRRAGDSRYDRALRFLSEINR